MSTEDVAVIGIKVETSGADVAKKNLDDLTGAGKKAEGSVAGLQAASERTSKSLKTLGQVATGVAASMGAGELIQLSDQYSKYTAQVKLATTGTAGYATALGQVRSIANSAQQDIAGVGNLFARISNGTRELGLSQQRVAAVTEAVALSLKVSNAGAGESASAMLQLSQAFASGALRGEEFNAVNEAAPRLMKALADGIGAPVGALKDMASQGKLTSEVLAGALPRALGELRDEAKSVQTIAGSFTVLKNNILEFVGTGAQASGAVATITTAIDALSKNLNLVTSAVGGIAAAKLADVLLGIAGATAKGVGSTLAYAEALNAQRIAAIGSAEAEAAAATATTARLQATQAGIVAAREEYVARLALSNATIASSQATIQQATATLASSGATLQAARSAGALSYALAAAREAGVAMAGASATQAAATQALAAAERQRSIALAELAVLGQQQVRVSAQVTAATVAQTAAQTALAGATSAGGAAAGLASRALGFLGGPIGVITTLLGLGVTAWLAWGSASKDAQKVESDAVESTTAEIIANLDKQNQKLRERIELGKQLGLSLGQEASEGQKRQAKLGSQIADLQAGRGIDGGAPLPEAARVALMQTLLKQYGELENRLQTEKGLKGEDAQTKSANDLIEVRQRLMGVNKQYLEDLEKYKKALDTGAISEAKYIEEVSALAKKTYDSSAAGKAAKAGEGALNDSLSAQVQAYKNADDLIIKNKQAAVEEIARLAKMGSIGELDAVDRTLEIEEAAWAKRKANFDAEIAQAAQKKNSAAEVARISGQAATAEAEYQRTVAKLTDDATAAQYKQLDVLDAIAKKANAARSSLEGQLYDAKGEAERIGVTGAALGELTKKRVDDAAAALEQQAAAIAIVDPAAQAVEALRAQAKAMRDLFQVTGNNSAAQAVYDYGKAVREQNAALQYELSLMGLSEQQRNVLLEQKRIELDLEKQIDAIKARTAADPAKQAELIGKANADASIAKANAANKAFLDEWKTSVGKYDDIFRQGFADMLNNGRDGWKSFTRSLVTTFKTAVADQIYKMFAQKFVVNIVGNLMGVVGGGVASTAAAAAGGSSAASGASTALSAASLFGAGGLGGSLAAGAGWLTGATTLGGSLTAGASLIGTGTLAGLTSGLGVLAGALGPIALGVGALMAIAKATKGETRTGGQFGIAFDGSVTNQRRGQTYTIEGQQFDRDFTNGLQTALKDGIAYRLEGDPVAQESAIREAVAGTASGINGFLKALGSAATLTGFSAGFETSSKDRGGNFAGGIFNTGATFGESGKGDNYQGTLYEKFSTNSPDFKTALENFTLDLKQSTIQALQTVSDIPETVKKLLAQVDAEGLTEDAANKLLETINAQIVGVNQLKDAFSAMGMDRLAALSFDVAAGLAEVSGGFDKLQGNLQTYYTNFFSPEEQRANMQRQLAQQLQGVGVGLPDINATDARAQYRRLVEAAEKDLSEEGRKTYATLLALSGAFASITDAADGAAEAVKKQQDAVYSQFQRALGRDRDGLNSQASALQDTISGIADAVDTLRSNARDLYQTVDGTRNMLAAQGMVYIEQALAGVRAGGSVADYSGLSDAISAARSGIDGGRYATQFERERDALVLAGQLSQLADSGELQLSFEERQLRAVNEQLEYLNTLDKRAEELVNGTTTLTGTVQSYFDQLLAILKPADPEQGQGAQPGGAFAGVGGGGGGVMGTPVDQDALLKARIDQQLRFGEEKGLAFNDPAVLASINAALYGSGATNADIARLYDIPKEDVDRLFAGAGIPRFDIGTNYVPRDMLAYIHEGEAVVPKAYNPAANPGAGGGSNADLAEAVNRLAEQNAILAARLEAIENNTKLMPQMGRQFNDVTNGGTVLRSKAVA